ncbi:MAG: hypothetical protein JO285_00015, partial [Kutzneria sp.]|nr:hypothetical protein [Kutzneria sp.]
MPRPAISPVVWQPPAAPPRARRPESVPPMPPPVLVDLDAIGPEDVVVDPDGQPITGVEDGRILRLTDEGQRIEQLADTGGRPDGIELMADGGLLVCDARLGLLRIDPVSGQVRTLVAAG